MDARVDSPAASAAKQNDCPLATAPAADNIMANDKDVMVPVYDESGGIVAAVSELRTPCGH